MPFCTNCGKEIGANVKFCYDCGAKIEASDANEKSNYDVKINVSIVLDNDRQGEFTDHVIYLEHAKKSVSAKIPNNIRVGESVRLRGAGKRMGNGSCGDVLICINNIIYKDDESKDSDNEVKYEGNIHRCHHCGTTLESFVSHCPACGNEIRNTQSTSSVREFAARLDRADTFSQRENIIRSYPVPNTKEDIFEFMILAATNVLGECDDCISAAWLTKVEQCYQKAKIVISEPSDSEKITNIYMQIKNKKDTEIKEKNKKIFLNFLGRIALALCGLFTVIVSIIVDLCDGNGSALELLGCGVLIVSASMLLKRNALLIDCIANALCGMLIILFGVTIMGNGSLAQLGGGAILIIATIASCKALATKR